MLLRSNLFDSQVKRRFVVGSYALLAENQKDCFLKAQKARRVIVDKVNEILNEYDVIYSPCSGKLRNTIKETVGDDDSNIIENHLAIANFAGLPSLTLPIGFVDNFPLGANFTGKAFKEEEVLNISYALESNLSYKNLNIKAVK